MNEIPLFSIIIPVYNVEAYLNKCIDSVLSQSFKNYELILVDDGSFDKSPQICDTYTKRGKKVRVIHKKNGGQSSARNVGIDNASGEYLVFIDSDDYLCDDKLLEKLADRIIGFDEDMILYGCKIEHKDGRHEITRGSYDMQTINCHDKTRTLNLLFSQGNFPGSAWIYTIRKSVIQKNKFSFVEGVSAEDYEWVINSLILSKTIGAINGVHYVYVKHKGSITTKADCSHLGGIVKAFERYKELCSRYDAIDKFIARIYLLTVMSFNSLSPEYRKMAKPILEKYKVVLVDAGQKKYYWFVKLFGLRISSFVIQKAYKFVR